MNWNLFDLIRLLAPGGPVDMLIWFITYMLPWGLSCITIWMTLLAGNHHPRAWLLGLLNQALWLVWMLVTHTWGLLPLNAALWWVYWRNHVKWKRENSAASLRSIVLRPDTPPAPSD